MVQGYLTPDGRPVYPVEIGGEQFIAVLDTGFAGGLQLPASWLVPGGPDPLRTHVFQFGDGSQATLDVYEVTLTIVGRTLTTELIFNGPTERLIGYEVLKHFVVTVDYPGGTVALDGQ